MGLCFLNKNSEKRFEIWFLFSEYTTLMGQFISVTDVMLVNLRISWFKGTV